MTLRTDAALQEFLASLSQLPGSLLYRDTLQWRALPPGEPGQFLTLNAELRPLWSAETFYRPAYQQYGGAGAHYWRVNINTSIAPWTIVASWQTSDTGVGQPIFSTQPGFGLGVFLQITSTGLLQWWVKSGASTWICRLFSTARYDDGASHTAFCDYDPVAGTARIIVDGQNVDDLAHPLRVLTAGTPGASASDIIRWGGDPNVDQWFQGRIRFAGYRQVAGLAWEAFMDDAGHPRALDEITWTEWGAAPRTWHASGRMTENVAGIGPYNQSGSIVLADPVTWS